jgi:hypothetical protein
MTHDPDFDSKQVLLVLQYFLHNRNAADDLEGVLRFRLLDEVISEQLESVRVAIEWLVRQDLLTARPMPGRDAIYALNQSQVERALKTLEWLQSDNCTEAAP